MEATVTDVAGRFHLVRQPEGLIILSVRALEFSVWHLVEAPADDVQLTHPAGPGSIHGWVVRVPEKEPLAGVGISLEQVFTSGSVRIPIYLNHTGSDADGRYHPI